MKKNKLKSSLVFVVVVCLLFLLGFPLSMLMGEKQGKVVLDEKVSLPFEVDEKKKIVLLYFGYAGCQTICAPSLKEIEIIYKEVEATKKVVFYFINIAEEAGDLDAFVHYFHKDFVGLNLSLKERQGLMNELRAYSSEPLSENGEISHTGYLYMIKQKSKQDFELKAMYYTRPFNKKIIVSDVYKELK